MRERAIQTVAMRSPLAVCLLFVSLPLALAASVPGGQGLEDRVRMEVGVEDFSFIDLDLPEPSRDSFTVRLVHEGRERALFLRRHSLRAPGFRVRVYQGDGSTTEVSPPAPRTYRGIVVGEPESAVMARFDARGLSGTILSPGARPLVIRPLSEIAPGAEPSQHLLYEDGDWRPERPDLLPGDESAGGPSPPEIPGSTEMDGIGDSQYLAEIAFDVDYYYYLDKNSSVPECVAAVEEILNQVDHLYARDVMITYELTDILVRTEPYYSPFSAQNFFHLIMNEWTTNQTHIPHDLAHLMTNRPGIQYSGVAGLAAVCGPQAYGFSYDDVRIVAHEIAHNWAGHHCQDVAPCNVMCGECLLITPNLKETIIEFRDILTCLDQVGAHPDPLPPYAHPDALSVTREELAVMGPTLFDVLANDHDGNLDTLSIDDFDAVSGEGATITLSEGTGPDGRDQLLYTPPGWVFGGPDRFTYTVGDGTGLEATGTVTITVSAPGLMAHWKMDDGSGLLATDSSGNAMHAQLVGDTTWSAGHFGGAVELEGENGYLAAPPLSLNSNQVTMTGWLNWAGEQESSVGIMSCWDPENRAGMRLSSIGQLQYHWGDGLDSWGWWSNLYLPVGEWIFVALVVEPDRATIYQYDGTLHSSVNEIPHSPEKFSGILSLGARSPFVGDERFKGMMDDMRVYDGALSPEEIAEVLEDAGDKACNPDPPDNGRIASSTVDLSWSPGSGALSHDVYFGYDYLALRDATTASPEYAGNTTNLFHHPAVSLAVGTTYYWRIDEVADTGVVKGDVWLFKVVGPFGHWSLDETSGTVAVDGIGGRHGTYLGTPVLGVPGATPLLGNSITLDTVGDYVEIPDLQLHSNHITITSWFRRDTQNGIASGIVASNDLETSAGLFCGAGGELAYKWANRHTDWHSGLMAPLGEWVFAALVVRPGLATLYMGADGQITSATNVGAHPPQAFAGMTNIGCDALGFQGFGGGLDDVWIYDAALTADDLERIHGSGLERGEAGAVPDGARVPGDPLIVTKSADGTITIAWSSSCRATDGDYALYQGTVGDFASHSPLTCGTQGELSFGLTPSSGSRYYLVVPTGIRSEGSYGFDSEGSQRPQGAAACFPQAVGECD